MSEIAMATSPAYAWHEDQDPTSPTFGRRWVSVSEDGLTATSEVSVYEAERNLRRMRRRHASPAFRGVGRPPGTRNRPRPVSCSICGEPPGERQPILHFNLLRSTRVTDGTGRDDWTMRGAGSIDLCRRCWTQVTERSAIRRRPSRPRDKKRETPTPMRCRDRKSVV